MFQIKKIRADQLLVQQGLTESRSKAQSLILAGVVYAGTQRIDKPSELFSSDTLLSIRGKDHDFVSRGGVKLKAAIDHFQIDVKNKICLDVGASTGGFTDCLLKEGAQKVYAVDVGYGQLAWSLRQDPRVIVIERTNFREFDPTLLKDSIDLVVVDVSFISLKKIIPKIIEVMEFSDRVLSRLPPPAVLPFAPLRVCAGGGPPPAVPPNQKIPVSAIIASPAPDSLPEVLKQTLIFLIKPQFEVGREFIGKGGIVRDVTKQEEVVQDIQNFCVDQGIKINGVIPSPLLGHDGNQEYLLVGCR